MPASAGYSGTPLPKKLGIAPGKRVGLDGAPRGFERTLGSLPEGARLWVAWPKRTSKLAGEVSEDTVRACGLAQGWVDYKVCAVDADWSGLCFAKRR